MSDSMFFTEQIQTFVAAHPHEEGWKVYELPEVWVSKRHAFRYLLDFVRDRYPAALTRRMTAKCITENELLRTPTYAHPADPGTDWDLRHDLDSTDWYGLVQLEWRQHPIHVLSFPLYSGNCFTPAYYVATKSNDGLRQLAEELDAYGETRRQVGSRNIFVVNGDNLPIEPVSWDDVLLPSELAEAIRGTVTAFFQSEPCYRALGIPYRRGLLFAGPPGCGKTLTLKAVAYHYGGTSHHGAWQGRPRR